MIALLLAAGLTVTAPLPVTYNALPAVAMTVSHPGAAPPGANEWSCRSTKRPVVLLHGTHVNMALNWNALSPLLKNNGYCVFALNYGGLRAGQVGGTEPIEDSGLELAEFVERVRMAIGADEVDLVGHSQGGLLAQYYVKFLGGAAKVHDVVGLAPTSHGSDAAGSSRWIWSLLQVSPALRGLVEAADPAVLQQLRGSPFMDRMNSTPDAVPGVRYTTIATRYDGIVTPYRSQFLDGGRNVVVQDLCANDFADHLALAFDHVALREVLNALDPPAARPPDCSTPVLPLVGG
ncbi:lipase [Lentzea pudingi]|uniref:Lipase n=1 Tax=Lentzea pudingi TaxID=1789439 RepID=A0ABQ2IKP7_9PSEU|nr:alpha/beta fold hydrolase [Lentzea pudingi]GGN11475.1 lipase [Lentzea pudingi]